MAPIPTDANVASLLRRFRRMRGLTQEELAERAGVSVGAISYLAWADPFATSRYTERPHAGARPERAGRQRIGAGCAS
jgi:hypothetical protein